MGCTFRRLAAKCASMTVMERTGALLSPVQLGYGTPLGAEAAAHSARRYLADLHPDHVILKLDFKNAFNSIRRDKMLEVAKLHTPELFPFIYPAIQPLLPSIFMTPSSALQKGYNKVTLLVFCCSALLSFL